MIKKEKYILNMMDDFSKKEQFFKKEEPKKKTNTALILTVTVSILLLAFAIRPVIIGYNTYQDLQQSNYTMNELGGSVRDLQLKLATSESNLSVYSDLNQKIVSEWKQATTDLTDCLAQKKTAVSELELTKKNNEQQLTDLQDKLKTKDSDLQDKLKTKEDDLQKTLVEKDKETADQLAKKDEEMTTIKTDCSKKEETVSKLQSDFDTLVKNTAYSTCCKERIDHPSIKSYSLVNNKVICLEEGNNTLSC